jgi:hypothetical protein
VDLPNKNIFQWCEAKQPTPGDLNLSTEMLGNLTLGHVFPDGGDHS